MKFIKNTLAGLAAATFVLAQPAAAATRSYESLPTSGIQHSVSLDRTGAATTDAEQFHGATGGLLTVVLIFGVLLAIFAAAGLFDNGKDSTG